ncbi:UNKNOWN [Stylonychia lemnae]|uniref:Uncharacterized protein n=1 Tax=Stylonychia lemnae TaxID=5949 RepID=A0A078A535_STYLE|nr:UNKNOWN [Stylonychia lemnae]|eukprot:CDW76690.1 UNKNOWN [Stylonychia lemnae]
MQTSNTDSSQEVLPPLDIPPKRSRSQTLLNLLNDKNDIGILLRKGGADMRPININEFFGFNLETRIRQLVSDCVEPLKLHHEQTINRVKVTEDRIKKNAQQINEVGFIMQKTLQRSSSLEEVHQQILLMENERKVSESSIIAEVNQIRQLLRETHEKVISIEEVIRSDRRLHEMLKTDMNHMRNDINTFKDKTSDDYNKFRLDFQNKQDRFYSEVSKVTEQLQIIGIKSKNQAEALTKHETIIETYRNNFQELYDTVNDLNEKKMSKNTYEAELTQIRRDLINLKFKNEDTYQSLQMTDSYIDRYLRVDILNEIFEVIFLTSSDSEQMEKMVEIAKTKYEAIFKKIKDAEQAMKQQNASPERKGQPKLLSVVNKIKQAQSIGQPVFIESFNKVAYKVPTFERSDSKDGEPILTMKYDRFNGMKYNDDTISRSLTDLDSFRRKIIQAQRAYASMASPFKKQASRISGTSNQGLIKTLDNQDSIEEQYEDVDDEDQSENWKTDQRSDTRSMGSIMMFNPDIITSPRAAMRNRKLIKRPTVKKIIVNTQSSANSKTINELKEQTQIISNELVKNEGKHKHHQEKISVLEDLDDELKEIVIESQEQISQLFEKIRALEQQTNDLQEQTSKEDTRILQITEDSIKLQQTQVENMQKDLEEDLRRRIREKSNIDLAMKKFEYDISNLIEKEKKGEEVIGMMMETIRMIFQNSRILTSLIKQDEIDKQSIQLLGMKMNPDSNQNINRQKSKKSVPNVNSQITGISIDNSDELYGGMSQQSALNLPSKSVISIDKNCFSCSGQQNVVMNAFKMACLQYQPQRVLLGSESFERFDLIEQSVRNLEKMNFSPFMQSINQISFANQNNTYMPLLKDNLLNFSNQNIKEQDSVQIVKLDKWTTQTDEDHFHQNLNRSKSSTPQNNIQVIQRSSNELPNLPPNLQKIKQNMNEHISNRNLPELKKVNESYNKSLFKSLAQPKTARQLSRNLVLPSFTNLHRDGIATVSGEGSQTRSTNLLQQYNNYSSMTQQKKKRRDQTYNTSVKLGNETKSSSIKTPPPNNRNLQSADTNAFNSNNMQQVPIMQNVIMQKALQRQKQVKIPEIIASSTPISLHRPDSNQINQ